MTDDYWCSCGYTSTNRGQVLAHVQYGNRHAHPLSAGIKHYVENKDFADDMAQRRLRRGVSDQEEANTIVSILDSFRTLNPDSPSPAFSTPV